MFLRGRSARTLLGLLAATAGVATATAGGACWVASGLVEAVMVAQTEGAAADLVEKKDAAAAAAEVAMEVRTVIAVNQEASTVPGSALAWVASGLVEAVMVAEGSAHSAADQH